MSALICKFYRITKSVHNLIKISLKNLNNRVEKML